MSYSFTSDCRTVVSAKKKGGVTGSTTTLMAALAYAADHPDENVLVVCADSTTYSLSTYFSRISIQYPDLDPPVYFRRWTERTGVPLASYAIDCAKQVEATTMFIDMPPNVDVLEQAIDLADLVLAPTNVEAVDCEKVIEVKALADQHGKKVLCLLTRMAKEGQGQARIWREEFEAAPNNIHVSPTEVKAHSMYGRVLGALKKRSIAVKLPAASELGVYRNFGREVAAELGRPVEVEEVEQEDMETAH